SIVAEVARLPRADAIVISNHGGRQLDKALPTLKILQHVAPALKGDKVELLMDGGVRSGADVVAAVAPGAKAVLGGRAYATGAARHHVEFTPSLGPLGKIINLSEPIAVHVVGFGSLAERFAVEAWGNLFRAHPGLRVELTATDVYGERDAFRSGTRGEWLQSL